MLYFMGIFCLLLKFHFFKSSFKTFLFQCLFRVVCLNIKKWVFLWFLILHLFLSCSLFCFDYLHILFIAPIFNQIILLTLFIWFLSLRRVLYKFVNIVSDIFYFLPFILFLLFAILPNLSFNMYSPKFMAKPCQFILFRYFLLLLLINLAFSMKLVLFYDSLQSGSLLK